MKNSKWILMCMFILLGAVVFRTEVCAQAEDSVILDGIYIGTVNVSGMTRDQAADAVAKYMNELKGNNIQLSVNGQLVNATAGELGLDWGNEEILDRAAGVGQSGNLVKQYKVKKDLEQEQVRLPLKYGANRGKVESIIEERCLPLDCEPTDAVIRRESNEFVIDKDQPGITLNVEESVDAVMEYLTELWTTGLGLVELSAKVEEAEHTAAALYEIQDVLGYASTDYSSSSANRAQNIKNGAEKLNGAVLYPGESYSVCDAMVPFSEENGYAMAGSYASGAVVESFGGGICQVSTTLYLALLRSELEVTDRSNHSMTVKYVKLSMDAAISEGSKDLQFKNNLDTPVYIEGYTNGGEIGFVVYGKEYRPEGRTVTYESETLETYEPDVELKAIDAPAGKIEQSGSAYTGYKARLWKIVSENGEETKTQVNESSYLMRPTTYNIGVTTDNGTLSSKLYDAIEKDDLNAVYEALNNS